MLLASAAVIMCTDAIAHLWHERCQRAREPQRMVDVKSVITKAESFRYASISGVGLHEMAQSGRH